MEKRVRLRIGSKYPDLLPRLGLTRPEHAGATRWANRPPAQKQAPSNTVTAYEKGGLKIMFQCVRAPENPTMIQLNTLFTNSSPGAITEFIFQAAVPKEMKLQLQAASGTALSPHNQNDIKQVIKILNPSSAPLRIMMKIQYKLNGQPVQEQAVAQTFPVGF